MHSSRILSCLTHQAYADAIGKSTEFLSSDEAVKLYPEGRITFENFKQNKHNDCWAVDDWTDDTDQTILVLRAIRDVKSGKFADSQQPYLMAFATHIYDWYRNGIEIGSYRKKCCGVGSYVRWTVVEPDYLKDPYYYSNLTWENSDCDSTENGSLMRTGIIGAIISDDNEIIRIATEISMATHCDPRCIAACAFQSLLVNRLVNRCNMNIWEMIRSAIYPLNNEQQDYISNLLSPVYHDTYNPCDIDFNNPNIRGNVETALPLAIWYLQNMVNTGLSFESCVSNIAMLGGDADTNAAIFGVLAGAYKRTGNKFRMKDLLNA
jgi:ADP-ribosylglycohydrolase